MGSLYIKGSKLWARFKDERGQWKGSPTPYRPGDDAKARLFVKRLEKQCAAKRLYSEQSGEEPKGPITVARYAERWVADASRSDWRPPATISHACDCMFCPRSERWRS